MASAKFFEDLICWKKSRQLVNMVFKACETGKLSKDFGTRDQLRRAAVSVMNNIAEGHGRKGTREFIQFLNIAQSSSLEVKSMTYILADLEYLSQEHSNQIRSEAEEIAKIIRGLIRYLETQSSH